MNSPAADRFLNRMLRDADVTWPPGADSDFSRVLMERIGHHGLIPLMHSLLAGNQLASRWPEQVLQFLSDGAKAEAAYNLFRNSWIDRMVFLFNEADLQFLLIKGEAMARICYRQAFLRSRSDTDIFIPMAKIRKARSILEGMGMTVGSSVYKTHQFSAVSNWEDSAPVLFDIHWRISNNSKYARKLDFTQAWNDSVALQGNGELRGLSKVHSLVLACMHRDGSQKHDRNRLIWLYDIRLLAEQFSSEDWIEFIEFVVNSQAQAICADGLLASVKFCGAQVPESVIRELGEGQRRGGLATAFLSSNLSLLMHDMLDLPDMRSRGTLLKELFVPDADALLARYGKSSRLWLPFLYVVQIMTGLYKRLSLR